MPLRSKHISPSLLFFFMMLQNKRMKKYSGYTSTLFRSSELLAVQALCHQLGSQNALLVQIAWLQITNFAQYSGDEFRWASLLWI